MRFPKVPLALFGPSSVGKSTVAKVIAGMCGWSARHCSMALRQMASERGESAPFSAVVHRMIDAETRLIAGAYVVPRVIEGRYLHHVLRYNSSCLVIELVCDARERSMRASKRGVDLSFQDAEDERHIALHFARQTPRISDFRIDTTALTPLSVASTILEIASGS